MEINEDLKRRYVFRWGDGYEEAFDHSSRSVLEASGVSPPKTLPNLDEIGCRTESGREFRYTEQSKPEVLLKAGKEHPDEIVNVIIYSGILPENLYLKWKKKNSVCRVDLTDDNDHPITLWKNMPE